MYLSVDNTSILEHLTVEMDGGDDDGCLRENFLKSAPAYLHVNASKYLWLVCML